MINRDKQIHHLMQVEADLTAQRLLEADRPCICPLTQNQLKHQNQPDKSLQLLNMYVLYYNFTLFTTFRILSFKRNE